LPPVPDDKHPNSTSVRTPAGPSACAGCGWPSSRWCGPVLACATRASGTGCAAAYSAFCAVLVALLTRHGTAVSRAFDGQRRAGGAL